MNDQQAAPTPADPVVTAKAQGEANTNTAITQQLLNMTDQSNPNGTLKYDQTGTSTFTGADGKTYTVPKFSATTTLSPVQQQLLDLTNKTKGNLGQIGVDQSQKIGSLLGTNVNLNTATEDKIDRLGAARLDPMFARNEDALRTTLANRGIQPGSQAWNAEMTQFGQGKTDAYNQLYLSGRGQGVSEALAERNQPINEITALMSGSQVSQPTFGATPTTGVAGTDVAGITNAAFNNQMAGYKANLDSNNAMMGGLFGLGGTLGAAGINAMKAAPAVMMFSDPRLKKFIRRVGTSPSGLPVYDYEIFGRPERGFMADDVEQLVPDAVVTHPSGFKMVDYGKLAAADAAIAGGR